MAVAYPFAYPLELDASNKLSKIKVKNLYSKQQHLPFDMFSQNVQGDASTDPSIS